MIRELRWTDFEDLIDAYYSYYDEVRSEPELGIIFYHEKPSMAHEINWFSTLYEDVLKGDAVARVAEEDGHIVGICDVHRVRPGSEVSHSGVLGIAIRKEYRDRGIGKSLLKACLEECRDKFEIILLSVFSVNKRAISLYEKTGFEKYGFFPRSVLRNGTYYDEINMYYKLK